jgi:endonuclease YncB( thermonuclease family)
MKKILYFCLMVLVPAFAFGFQAKVVGVSDGDTINVLTAEKQQVKIRIYGVDAPEKSQAFGQKAKQFTSDLVFGKMVDVDTIDTDRYGRSVAIVKINGNTINEVLLKNGLAWLYGQYCKKPECQQWKAFELSAKKSGVGLWQDKNPMPPWDFRKMEKGARSSSRSDSSTVNNQQAGLIFHGNAKSMVFHSPGCKHYNCKSCTVELSSREAAIRAGYKPCGYCRP